MLICAIARSSIDTEPTTHCGHPLRPRTATTHCSVRRADSRAPIMRASIELSQLFDVRAFRGTMNA
ncbi:MAG: hypothetical protein DWI12_06050 [Planctomycetota bacterium]|nr:MAG: hypothetical protein DWI12_06050 [Planctomycetota bacterium]